MRDFRELQAKKSLGQHFLTNPRVVGKIVDAATITPGETVVEVGPGTGVLTRGLLEAGAQVIALEADGRAVELLRETFALDVAAGTFTLHHADVRETEISSVVATNIPYKVVANIPYYLTGQLIRATLSSAHQPETVVFLIQKEVAERICRSEKESLLSLSVKAYGTPRYVDTVKKGNFAPPPKVDSAILAIENISREQFTTHNLNESWFFTVLHAGFAARRKQLIGNFLENLPEERSRDDLLALFAELNIPPTTRGEDLSIKTWLSLAAVLQRPIVQ